MDRLPLLLALPHAGLEIPSEVAGICRLTLQEIIDDSDEDAAEIYDIEEQVAALVRSEIARTIVDVNRAEDEASEDGAIKTLTRRHGVPVYSRELSPELRELLLSRYHRPYHEKLSGLAARARLGIDCHTMAERQPGKRGAPPKRSRRRPRLCLSDDRHTCPKDIFLLLAGCLEKSFGCSVSFNHPFRGGYTIRRHARELAWVQLEISREGYASPAEKREMLCSALQNFCAKL